MSRIAFASDFDGTLARGAGTLVAREQREAIERFRRAGGLFGICTGRDPRAIRDYLGPTKVDFAIVLSGAMVVDGEWQVIYEQGLPRERVLALCRRYRERTRGLTSPAGWSHYGLPWMDRGDKQVVESFDELPDVLYGASLTFDTPEAAGEAAREIREDYQGVMTAYQNMCYVDVTPAGCSKGAGIGVLRDAFEVSLFGGIGDSYNDRSLLRAVDVPFTFPESPQVVRDEARHLVDSVAEALWCFGALARNRTFN